MMREISVRRTPHPGPLPVEGRGRRLWRRYSGYTAERSPSPLNGERAGVRGATGRQIARFQTTTVSGFTMVEIALCIAIIGFALVAIIGVLPSAMRVQQDNRADTIIDQDGTYLLEAIRHGSQGLDDLPRYIAASQDPPRTAVRFVTQDSSSNFKT